MDVLSLSVSELRRLAIETFRSGGGSRPDVLLLELDGRRLVLKDHNACDPWFGRLLGPLLAWREARGLTRVSGVAGVPRLVARPDRRSLLLEYLPAQPILRAENCVEDWAAFFSQLQGLIATIHDRGVAHCDLRSPNNTLVTPTGEPAIVDFVACVCRGRPWNGAWRWVFERFCAADQAAVAKLKGHLAPELLTQAEQRSMAERGRLERVARAIGRSVRTVTRRWFTGDRRA